MENELRKEIVEAQKSRIDLLKWKLILVAALGGVGLGVGLNDPATADPPIILLGLIPLVCLFVDLLCYHNNVRILLIGIFLRTRGRDTAKDYEEFAGVLGKKPNKVFQLEDWALWISTCLLSCLVAYFGCRKLVDDSHLLCCVGMVGGSMTFFCGACFLFRKLMDQYAGKKSMGSTVWAVLPLLGWLLLGLVSAVVAVLCLRCLRRDDALTFSSSLPLDQATWIIVAGILGVTVSCYIHVIRYPTLIATIDSEAKKEAKKEDEVRRSAHSLWEAAGKPYGSALSFWLLAEENWRRQR